MTELVTTNRGYQKPRPGQKLKDDVLRLIAALDAIDVDVAALLLALADKSDVGHGHGMDAISGLAAALGSKLDVGHHDALGDLTDVDIAGAANGMALLWQAAKWIPVALQINNIAGLEAALNGKATPADITAAINALVAAAPGVLDTLDELAAALGDDPNFAATVASSMAMRVRFDAPQTPSAAQQGRARTNIGAGILSGHRNKMMNCGGGFPHWQRGLSFAIPTGSFFTADRWIVYKDNPNDSIIVQRAATTGAELALGLQDGEYAMHFGWTGSNGIKQLLHRIEGVRTLAGQEATLAINVYTDLARTINPTIVQNFGTGGSAAVVVGAGPINLAQGWNRIRVKVAIPTIVGKTIGPNNSLVVYVFNDNWPGNGSFQIGRVALVAGDATTEGDTVFAPRDAVQELAMCQRYYEKSFPLDQPPVQGYGVGAVAFIKQSANLWDLMVYYKATKRVVPTVTTYSPNTASSHWSSNSGQPLASIAVSTESSLAIRADASGSVGFSYSIQWSAEAEL